jgi:hypothetical protein
MQRPARARDVETRGRIVRAACADDERAAGRAMKTGWEMCDDGQLVNLHELHVEFVRKDPTDALSVEYRDGLAAEMKRRGMPLPQQQPLQRTSVE